MFSFAVVSGAIGLYLINDTQFGERDGNVVLSLAIVISVGINAAVSPILGAFSDRGGRRMPFLLGFTALCIGATFFIADVPPVVGVALFIVANFAYQAALIYYDATLKTVSTPESRGRLSGIGTGIGYCGTVFIGLLIFLLDIPVEDRFRLTSILFLVFAIPIFWFVRERRRPDEQPRDPGGRRGLVRPAQAVDRARARGPGPVALPVRALLLLGRRQHRDRRDERRGREDDGPERGDGERGPAAADAGGDRHELRVGLARRPERARSGRSCGCSCRGPSA